MCQELIPQRCWGLSIITMLDNFLCLPLYTIHPEPQNFDSSPTRFCYKISERILLEYVFCSQWGKGVSRVEADFRRTSHRGWTYLWVFPIPYSYKAIFKTIIRQSDPYIYKPKLLNSLRNMKNWKYAKSKVFGLLFILCRNNSPVRHIEHDVADTCRASMG